MGQKNFGVAILGTGAISRFHARAVRDTPEARLVAVCSREKSRAETFASEFCCAAYVSLDAMLADPNVDILVIATPSGMHLDAAVDAAHAGKHVLCEKPLEITLERVDKMIHAHRQAGTQLGCIFQFRYIKALGLIRKALREGRFGTLTYAGIYVPWWRDDEYYFKSSWHGTRTLDGGGALMNQAIHMVDLLCDVMPPVESVSAYTSSIGHPGIETEDSAAAALEFRGGAVGVIFGSTSSWPGLPKRLEISGTGGSAILVDEKLSVFNFRDRKTDDLQFITEHNEQIQAVCGGASDPLTAMTHGLHSECFKDFVNSLRCGIPYQSDGTSARRSVALIEAIYKSVETGQRVRPSLFRLNG